MTIRRCKPSDRDPDRPAKDQVWCLYSKDEDKLLGRHPTKEKAEKQERAVQIQKARSKGHNIPKKGARIPRKAELHAVRSNPKNLFKGRKGTHEDVLIAIKHQAVNAFRGALNTKAIAESLRRVAKALNNMLK